MRRAGREGLPIGEERVQVSLHLPLPALNTTLCVNVGPDTFEVAQHTLNHRRPFLAPFFSFCDTLENAKSLDMLLIPAKSDMRK